MPHGPTSGAGEDGQGQGRRTLGPGPEAAQNLVRVATAGLAALRCQCLGTGDRMAHETASSTATNSVPRQREDNAAPASVEAEETTAGDRWTGELARPVPLDRLLIVAVLTPGQAVFIASKLLTAAAAGSGGDLARVRLGRMWV